MAASYTTLAPSAQQMLAPLGNFASSFVPEHVVAVAERPLPDTEDNLRQLHNQSLLTVNRRERYEMHPLVRHFCLELPQQPNRPHRFVAHFVNLAAQPEAAAEQPHVLAAINLAEQLECEEGLVLARQAGNAVLEISLLGNLGLVEKANGRLAEAIVHYEAALSLARQIDDPPLISNLLQNLGVVHEQRSDYAQARERYEEGLQLAEMLAAAPDQTKVNY